MKKKRAVRVTLYGRWAIITAPRRRHVFGRRILDRLLHLLSCEGVFILISSRLFDQQEVEQAA
jgi:hypothetical protein